MLSGHRLGSRVCPYPGVMLGESQEGFSTNRDDIKISDVTGSGFGTNPSAEYEALIQPQKDNPQECKRSPSQSSHGRQMDMAKAKEERGRAPVVSKKTTNNAGHLQHLSTKTYFFGLGQN
eukprot:6875138-Ditylum_brightwellii.AAC.1